MDVCTVNWTTETEGIQREKAALNPLVSRWCVFSNLVFVEGRPDLHRPLQQTNEQTLTIQNKKNLNLLTITFLAVYLKNEQR